MSVVAKSNKDVESLHISMGKSDSDLSESLARRESVVIGRGQECDVVIKDVKASRRHCKLSRLEEGGFVLEDLDSRNGTFVDGIQIEKPIQLKPKQTFKIGDTVFYIS